MEPTNNNEKVIPQAPVIPESEMKLPEEGVVGVTAPPVSGKYLFNPLLAALLVLLLVILAVVIIWGETLIGMILPLETAPAGPTAEEQAAMQAADELQRLEAELNTVNLSELDTRMNALEVQIEADLAATSSGDTDTATTTAE